MNVSAKMKGTGKCKSITYKGDFVDGKLGHGVRNLLEQDGSESNRSGSATRMLELIKVVAHPE